jgi:WD40 repeat protein
MSAYKENAMNRQPQRHLKPAAAWTKAPRFARNGALIALVLAFVVGCQRGGLPEAKEPATPTPRKNSSKKRPIENVWLVIDGVYFTGDGKGILTTFRSEPTMLPEQMPRYFRHGSQRRLTLWDAATGRERWTIYGGPRFGPIACLPDGKHALLSNTIGNLELWDVDKGKRNRSFEGYTRGIVNLVLSSDGHLALVGDNDRLFLWDVEKGKPVRYYYHDGGLPLQIFLSPDSRYVMADFASTLVEEDGLMLWDGKTGKVLRKEKLHSGWSAAAFSPNGRLLLALWKDQKAWKESMVRKDYMVLMEAKSGKEIRRFETGSRMVTFSADGKYLLNVNWNHELERWEIASGRLVYRIEVNRKDYGTEGINGGVTPCVFSPDRNRAATAF